MCANLTKNRPLNSNLMVSNSLIVPTFNRSASCSQPTSVDTGVQAWSIKVECLAPFPLTHLDTVGLPCDSRVWQLRVSIMCSNMHEPIHLRCGSATQTSRGESFRCLRLKVIATLFGFGLSNAKSGTHCVSTSFGTPHHVARAVST